MPLQNSGIQHEWTRPSGGGRDVPVAPLLLEQRVPFFPRVAGGSARLPHQVHMSGRLKIITVVGLILVAHPLGLVFPALVVDRGIKEAAIPATMQVRVALGARVIFQDFLRGNQLHRVAALEAGKGNVGHGRILPRPRARRTSFPPRHEPGLFMRIPIGQPRQGRQNVAHGGSRGGTGEGGRAPAGATDFA